MAYPSSIDAFTSPAGGTAPLATGPDHAALHTSVNTAIGTIETVLGTNSGTAVLMNFTVGKFAARTAGETMTNTDMRGYYTTPQGTTVAAGGTATFDLSLSNEWRVTMGTGNATFAVSNAVNGMKFIVAVTEDSVGTRTITWWNTIRWQDATAPTTSAGTKRDIFGFDCTSASTFDGVIIAQGI